MQRIAVIGLMLNLASDIAVLVSNTSGIVFAVCVAAGAVPAWAGICRAYSRTMTDGTEAEMAAFRVSTIRR
jgi:hypothetical protein